VVQEIMKDGWVNNYKIILEIIIDNLRCSSLLDTEGILLKSNNNLIKKIVDFKY